MSLKIHQTCEDLWNNNSKTIMWQMMVFRFGWDSHAWFSMKFVDLISNSCIFHKLPTFTHTHTHGNHDKTSLKHELNTVCAIRVCISFLYAANKTILAKVDNEKLRQKQPQKMTETCQILYDTKRMYGFSSSFKRKSRVLCCCTGFEEYMLLFQCFYMNKFIFFNSFRKSTECSARWEW